MRVPGSAYLLVRKETVFLHSDRFLDHIYLEKVRSGVVREKNRILWPFTEHQVRQNGPGIVEHDEKRAKYMGLTERIWLLIDQSTDWVAAMATMVCELHSAFDYYHWTGSYRTIRPDWLQVGPYQGGDG